jgi:hypothetical protein
VCGCYLEGRSNYISGRPDRSRSVALDTKIRVPRINFVVSERDERFLDDSISEGHEAEIVTVHPEGSRTSFL